MFSTELMIGDWVMLCNQPIQIFGIKMGDDEESFYITNQYGGSHHIKLIEPIPLTPEILKKNSLGETLFESEFSHIYSFKDGSFCVRVYFSKDTGRAYKCYIHHVQNYVELNGDIYVHRLQHALRLCGIYKEIVI